MSIYLGDFPTSGVVYVPFHTFNSTGASVTISNFALADIAVYRDGSTTQRASTAGYALLDTDGIDFDGLTGVHGFSIDTSDNTDAGFWAAGHEYWVVVGPITCDGQTLNFVAATFSIERNGGALALLKHATYGLAALNTDVDAILLDTGTDGVVLANDAITAAKIAADAITSSELAATATAEIAAAIWAYVTRTLTSTAAATLAATTGSTLNITTAATYAATISGLTISATWTKIWLTLKRDESLADTTAILQIVVSNPGVGTDGMLYKNGAAGVAAEGSLTVNQVAGTVAIAITDEGTDDLTEASGLEYDIKQLVAAGDTTVLTAGSANIAYTPTKAIA